MTTPPEIRLERLLGRVLVDARGFEVGSIEDVVAEPAGDEYEITHVLIGPHGRLARVLALAHHLPPLRALGLGGAPRIRRVPWTWLDLSDPMHPRLIRSVLDHD